jgi:peroxiredoxin
MKNNLFLMFIVLFLFCSFTNPTKEIKISNFKLKSAATNNWVSLSDYKNAKGFIVVFISNKCPMARFYSTRLNQINDTYKSSNVPVLALNSMDTLVYANESFSKMQKKAKTENLNFPYLQDKKQNVAKQFKAENTPQAFVIWKDKLGKFIIKYQGAIDDNAGEPDKVKNHFLTNAVDQLLQGKQVAVTTSQSFGCRIFYRGIKDKMK